MVVAKLGQFAFYTPPWMMTAARIQEIRACTGTTMTDAQLKAFGFCGNGPEWQNNITKNSKERIRLFDIPKKTDKDYDSDLARLAQNINDLVEMAALPLVRQLRDDHGDESLEVTVHISRTGFRLVYARSGRKLGATSLDTPKKAYPTTVSVSVNP